MHTVSYANVLPDRPAQPAWLAGSAPDVQDLYLFWADCAQDRALPRRADIDFAALAAALPGVLLAELNAARRTVRDSIYLYRSIAEVGAEGDLVDPSGGFDPDLFQHIPLGSCLAAAARREPVNDRVGLMTADGLSLDYEVIFLPLSPDGIVVDGILILAVELPLDEGEL